MDETFEDISTIIFANKPEEFYFHMSNRYSPVLRNILIHLDYEDLLNYQKVCKTWNIPYLSLDETRPQDIASVLDAMEVKPRVITATISKVAMEEVQRALRLLPVVTICVDEAQVL